MKSIYLLFFANIFMLSSVEASSVYGTYESSFKRELRYHLTYAKKESLRSKAFIYIEGDGDICSDESHRNNFESIIKTWWTEILPQLTTIGTWIVPEKISDKYCVERENRLDGLDFYHRVDEMLLFIKKLEKDHPEIKEIYLMGHSAGPRIATILVDKLKRNPKLKGLIINTGSVRHFEIFITELFFKIAQKEKIPFDIVYEGVKKTHAAFRDLEKEGCSGKKKTMAGRIGIEPTEPTEAEIRGTRTNNFYCQFNERNFERRFKKIPKNLKVLVLQPNKDSKTIGDIDEGADMYNHLMYFGKKASFRIVDGLTHNWADPKLIGAQLGYINDWVNGIN